MTLLRSLLAVALLLTLAATPAAAQEEPVLLQPCTNTAGATVVTPADAFSDTVPTPVGALGLAQEQAGTFVVDLAGLPVGTRRTTTLTLEMPDYADYDMVVNGENPFSTDVPEVFVLSARNHCARSDVQTEVFLGLPIDELTLTVDVA
jgi:hypothetical protein